MRPRTYKPTGVPADEVLTNAEWLYLLGELLDADLTLLANGAQDAVSAHCLTTLLTNVMDRHTDEICTHCHEHLECHKAPGPDNPACKSRWCRQAIFDWLSSPCAEPDDD